MLSGLTFWQIKSSRQHIKTERGCHLPQDLSAIHRWPFGTRTLDCGIGHGLIKATNLAAATLLLTATTATVFTDNFQFRRRDLVAEDVKSAPAVIGLNSHDRSSGYELRAGLFRFVCNNGLMVADGLIPAVHVRHSGQELGQIIQASGQILNQRYSHASARGSGNLAQRAENRGRDARGIHRRAVMGGGDRSTPETRPSTRSL